VTVDAEQDARGRVRGHGRPVGAARASAPDGANTWTPRSSRRRWPTPCGIERPELAEDEGFRNVLDRSRNKPALFAELEKILAGDTTEGWVARLRAAGVPSGPVRTIDQAHASPQARAREMFVEHSLTPWETRVYAQRPRSRRRIPQPGRPHESLFSAPDQHSPCAYLEGCLLVPEPKPPDKVSNVRRTQAKLHFPAARHPCHNTRRTLGSRSTRLEVGRSSKVLEKGRVLPLSLDTRLQRQETA